MSDSPPSSLESSSSETCKFNAYEERIAKALYEGAFHLPGNSWCEDWIQFFANNHPLFANCLQHRLHPVTKLMRLFGMIGSVMFGLALTNICWLWFIYDQTQSTPIFTVSVGGVVFNNGTQYVYLNNTVTSLTQNDVTPGMFVLWTIGSIIHAIYDTTIWYAASCACCSGACAWMKEKKNFGKHFVIVLVLVTSAISTAFVIIRASLQSNPSKQVDVNAIRSAGLVDDAINIHVVTNGSKSNWSFVMSYGLELFIAWFVFFPIVETILFSGILSCGGRLRCLGGRPREMKKEQEEMKLDSSSSHSDP